MITSIFTHILLFLVHLFSHEILFLQASQSDPYSTNFTTTCWEVERNALLKFKAGLKDPSGRLSSWVGNDCCAWQGVNCSKQTGHVTMLNLRNQPSGDLAPLQGKLDPSLLDLKYLNYLDLSLNNFEHTPIPNFIGSFTKLSYLILSNASFAGLIPPHLGNLSNLCYLDLSWNNFLWVSHLNWISGLSLLKNLFLIGANLNLAATNWLQAVNMLPLLVQLHIPYCNLNDLPPSLRVVNLSSIEVVNLQSNNFNSPLPSWLFNISTLVELDLSYSGIKDTLDNVDAWKNLCNLKFLALSGNDMSGEIVKLVEGLSKCSNNSLEVLDLSTNGFVGPIPPSLENLKNMRYLSLSWNYFYGPLPVSIGNLSSLKVLHLSSNKLGGTVPETVGQLKELSLLYLGSNNWEGVVSRIHFLHLKNLKDFALSSNHVGEKSLTFHVGHDWVPPFSLNSIIVVNCQMDLKFPAWFLTQKELAYVILWNINIEDFVPEWFWKLSPQIELLVLSNTRLRGKLPKSLKFAPGSKVALSFNLFEGPIPHFSDVTYLCLKKNLLSGPIPENFGQDMLYLRYMDLSENNFNGNIPSSISMLKYLEILDLSKNNFSGNIPSSFCSLQSQLLCLNLNDNNLYGKLSSLRNCSKLLQLNLANNQFHGGVPRWIGESLPMLTLLGLGGNMFRGKIPKNLCFLSNLHVLDLKQNSLSGLIPSCLGNLSNLVNGSYNLGFDYMHYLSMDLIIKGQRLKIINKPLALVTLIDLSRNNLEGELPKEITQLYNLVSLSLSQNNLTGEIPEKIGALRLLETLDLSNNRLSGSIPASMSSMTFLSHLNLSYNDLSGSIPSTNQFQTFNDPSIFEGNPKLCGAPLQINCSIHRSDAPDDKTDKGRNGENIWFYIGVVSGFVVGFWAVLGTLVIKRSWRHAYFRFVEEMTDRICVFTVVKATCLQKMLKGERS
ncbi:hypothetical protein SLEP1_g55569 [Rubroshorea leprosula]|uniref:Leucine-rich repeat-containing N-terminal plant-type domain-containing protein n=2 Tax=Rubroshorea leprosula TaxID=152421 RepID=A0AAV5MIZ7_9ROSI|nr:hypothetical protein SLEP1_g55569 [Rubroshorea leprosula]